MPQDQAMPSGVAAVVDVRAVTAEGAMFVEEESEERARRLGGPTLAEVLAEDKRRALDVFSDADLRAVEAAIEDGEAAGMAVLAGAG